MSHPGNAGVASSTTEDSTMAKEKTDQVPSNDAAKVDETKAAGSSQQPISSLTRILILVSVFLSMFLVAIDRTIVSTVRKSELAFASSLSVATLYFQPLTSTPQAIPQITDDFNSLNDAGWYGSAYMLTCCAFQLLFGKFYAFYSVRGTLVASILIFEAGSALCGAAPSSSSFIAGRAIAGVGAAGIFAGTVSLIIPASSPSLLTMPISRWYRWCTLFLSQSVHEFKASWALLAAWLPF